jgi:hypothetical protein
MTEIDVALTDYLLFVEAGWFAYSLGYKHQRTKLTPWFVLMFTGFAAASFLGGTSHGFFNDPAMALYQPVWWLTMLAIGIASTGFAVAGGGMLSPTWLPTARILAVIVLISYAIITFRNDDFLMAIYFYVPATLLCFAGFFAAHRKWPGQKIHHGMTGIATAWLASVLQQAEISIHPVYFTHNALYHVILMLALYLIYRGSTGVVAKN